MCAIMHVLAKSLCIEFLNVSRVVETVLDDDLFTGTCAIAMFAAIVDLEVIVPVYNRLILRVADNIDVLLGTVVRVASGADVDIFTDVDAKMGAATTALLFAWRECMCWPMTDWIGASQA